MSDSNAVQADFAAFVGDQGQRLLRLAFLLTGGNGAAAEDLVHSVLLRLAERGIADLDEPGSYARRAVINEFNSQRRRVDRDHRLEDHLRVVQPTTASDPSPEDRLTILAVLRQLGERERAAIVLRYYEDLADADIAAILGCSRSTVRSLIHRAMPKLRRGLSDAGDDTSPARGSHG